MNDCKTEFHQIPLYTELNSYHYAFQEISIIHVECTIGATIIMQNCLCNVQESVKTLEATVYNAFAFRVRSLLHKSFIFNFPN